MTYTNYDDVIAAYKNGQIGYATAFGLLVGTFQIPGGTARDWLTGIVPDLPPLPPTSPSLETIPTGTMPNVQGLDGFWGFFLLFWGMKV
jgi:hypothetical protein